MNLATTINKLREYLEEWYNSVKTIPADGVRQSYGPYKPLNTYDLNIKALEFYKLHPEALRHERNIQYSFKIKPDSYRRGCWCGDCDIFDHAVCTGIHVESIDWDRQRNLAFASVQLDYKQKYNYYDYEYDFNNREVKDE
jgi:hypothetical protein